MTFNYEQSLWGKGTASLAWSNPTAFRLRQMLWTVKNLSAGQKVLEVGCGAGQFIRAVQQTRPELECHGCDISERAIEAAKSFEVSQHPRLPPSRGVIVTYAISRESSLPYEAETFGAIIISDVLEHVLDPAGLVQEVGRVLKKGGLLYCFIPCEGDWLAIQHWLHKLGIRDYMSKKFAGHVNHFSRQQWLSILTQEHFQPVRLHYSEHLLGQLVMLVTYMLMDRAARRQGGAQMNNEGFYEGLYHQTKQKGLMNFLRRAGNSLVYLESRLLGRVPSPNVHVVLRKS